jgi:hypothetical protein
MNTQLFFVPRTKRLRIFEFANAIWQDASALKNGKNFINSKYIILNLYHEKYIIYDLLCAQSQQLAYRTKLSRQNRLPNQSGTGNQYNPNTLSTQEIDKGGKLYGMVKRQNGWRGGPSF